MISCEHVEVRVNGVDFPIEQIPSLAQMDGQQISLEVERLVMRDTIESVIDGRPTQVRRTFRELTRETQDAEGEEETLSGVLEGMTVRITLDENENENELSVELLDDEEVEQGFLERHPLVLHSFFDLDIEEGGSLTVTADELQGLGSRPEYFELADEAKAAGAASASAAMFEDGMTLEWTDTVQEDGMTCAVLTSALDIDLDLGESMGEMFDGLAGDGELSVPAVIAFEMTALVDTKTSRTRCPSNSRSTARWRSRSLRRSRKTSSWR